MIKNIIDSPIFRRNKIEDKDKDKDKAKLLNA
jgi:hypothetical protein